jgi:hypothetical protein
MYIKIYYSPHPGFFSEIAPPPLRSGTKIVISAFPDDGLRSFIAGRISESSQKRRVIAASRSDRIRSLRSVPRRQSATASPRLSPPLPAVMGARAPSILRNEIIIAGTESKPPLRQK